VDKPSSHRGWIIALAGVLIIATVAAYHNSFFGPFVFDGESAIVQNPTIRHLWPIGQALCPPLDGSPVSGRPVVNLSLAINYALGGLEVSGYHAANLAIHILAALTLFGIVRRTLLATNRGIVGSIESSTWPASLIAAAAAALWAVHPLQTESVTYVAQRAESLMGLFYLLTLYCFIRGTGRVAPRIQSTWFLLSITTCFLGMATKEVMATAPVIVFLYDRTFVAGKFITAWQQRRRFYIGLGSTWLLLVCLMIRTGARGGTVGFNTSVSWWGYAITQSKAIISYLTLAIWPSPLVIDYGVTWGGSAVELLIDGLIIGVLMVASVVGIWRRPALGFLGAWFFVILAPTSSVVPIATEIIAEHRMYLPLAAISVLAAVGLYRWLGEKSPFVYVALILALGCGTVRRNAAYRSEVALWEDAVVKVPDNAGAHNNLGWALAETNNLPAAIPEFEKALKLSPRMAGARSNLGIALMRTGKTEEAIVNYQEVLKIYPDLDQVHTNLARALNKIGRTPEAIAEFKEALRLKPDSASGHNELGLALDKIGPVGEAIAEYREALRLKPDFAEAHYNLGNALAQSGQLAEGIIEYQAALVLNPAHADAETNLGGALLQSGHATEAIHHFEAALILNPNSVDARMNRGSALVAIGKAAEAIPEYEAALRLQPDNGAAHYNLGVVLRSLGRTEEATVQFHLANKLGTSR
jgi:tetratricopeptide (TPR) repeat protein